MWQLRLPGGTYLRLPGNKSDRSREWPRRGPGAGEALIHRAASQETFGARDMSGLRRYEVALEAEEEIYWGCFYFFPWLRMWRRERSSAHPREQKLEPLRGLMSCLSNGLGPAPQRSGRGLPRRTPAATAQPAGALKI
ncbi:uncharacterized protein [Equus asinus]|uniref:Uncharacterized protein isoform X1 n=1 Tax=Equus przewalskii TaxID=9798 RepID=A0ABM4M169_EQUPR|nr:uncharacterized protein LOC111770210 isoform X1 [Equus caballus]XP_044612572.1 uncharacterized protein LOC123280097 isoform X1 [Equus asinus]